MILIHKDKANKIFDLNFNHVGESSLQSQVNVSFCVIRWLAEVQISVPAEREGDGRVRGLLRSLIAPSTSTIFNCYTFSHFESRTGR